MDLETYFHKHSSVTALARAIGAWPQSVTNWSKGDRQVPAERCPSIEHATGGIVPCEEMRPDLPWARVKDAKWPHPSGRPVLDLSKAVQSKATV